MDEIDDILKVVDSYAVYSYTKQNPSWHLNALLKAVKKGYIIKTEKTNYQIAPTGEKIIRSGLGWELWEQKYGIMPSIQIGNTINARDIIQSDFSNKADNILNKDIHRTTTDRSNNKKSKLEIVYWIVTIILTLGLIYELLHKYKVIISF